MNMHTETPVKLPPIGQRLNLIFHGLMAFREAGDAYEVLLPRPHGMGHVRRYGNPFTEIRPFSEESPYYRLEGVHDCAGHSPQPTGKDGLLFDNTLLEVQRDQVATTIVVPKPNLIRGYRAVEVRGTDLAVGDCTHRALHGAPDVINEVNVFSYFDFHNPTLASDDDTFPVEVFGPFWNLCIYSQSPVPTFGQDHSKLFNSMFRVRRPGGGSDPLHMKVSVQGGADEVLADDPPLRTAARVGIRFLELLSLSELYLEKNAAFVEHAKILDRSPLLTADPSSCSGGYGNDSPGAGG